MMHQGESVSPFQASMGWLWRFCQHHGIRQRTSQGEKVSSDVSAVESFKQELRKLVDREGLSLDQLYNYDETRLCYRMLPSKTLATRSERGAGAMKKQKLSWLALMHRKCTRCF